MYILQIPPLQYFMAAVNTNKDNNTVLAVMKKHIHKHQITEYKLITNKMVAQIFLSINRSYFCTAGAVWASCSHL